MKFNDTGWKKDLSPGDYSRRLSAFMSRMSSGIDRGDEHAAVAHIAKLFSDLEAQPLDRDALARDEADAKILEDGE